MIFLSYNQISQKLNYLTFRVNEPILQAFSLKLLLNISRNLVGAIFFDKVIGYMFIYKINYTNLVKITFYKLSLRPYHISLSGSSLSY